LDYLSRRIGIDIDGVVRNLYYPLIQAFRQNHKTYKIDPIEEWTNYEIWNHFKLNGKPCNEAWFKNLWFDRHAEYIYRKGAFAYPYACEVLKHLKSKGHKIIFISAQPNQLCMGLTIQWLNDWKVPWNEIHFTDYYSKHKVDCDVYIEDSPMQFSNLVMNNKPVWMYSQPWNKSVPAVNRFNDWLEIEKEINRRFQ